MSRRQDQSASVTGKHSKKGVGIRWLEEIRGKEPHEIDESVIFNKGSINPLLVEF